MRVPRELKSCREKPERGTATMPGRCIARRHLLHCWRLLLMLFHNLLVVVNCISQCSHLLYQGIELLLIHHNHRTGVCRIYYRPIAVGGSSSGAYRGVGTMFPDGAEQYIAKLGQLIPLNGGLLRTASDMGCGVRGQSVLQFLISFRAFSPLSF